MPPSNKRYLSRSSNKGRCPMPTTQHYTPSLNGRRHPPRDRAVAQAQVKVEDRI